MGGYGDRGDSYWTGLARGRVSRRRLLQSGALTSLGLAAAGVVGCGSSSNSANNGGSNAAPAASRAAAPASATATSPAAASATAAGGSPAATSAAPTPPAAQAGLKTGGVIQGYITGVLPLDPVENTTYRAQYAAGFHYARLFRFQAGTDPKISLSRNTVPDLVEKYEVSGDGLQYTLHLRQGVNFHPPLSRPLTTADVQASYQYFTTNPKNTNRTVFDPIVDSLTAPDDKTLLFKLKAPYVPFLNKLANPQYVWIMPKDAIDRKIDPAQQAVGTGPWILQSNNPTAITWKKNPDYWNKGIPYADGAVLNVIPDLSTQEAQFQAGKLDIYERSAAADYDDLKKANPKASVVEYTPNGFAFLFFHDVMAADSVFKDVRVRRAASLAIDRQALIDSAYNGRGVWANIINAGLGRWYLDPQSKDQGDSAQWFKHDPQQARQLLSAAGALGTEFKFFYPNNAYGDIFNAYADAARGMLSDAGFKVQSVTVDYLKDWIDTTHGYWATGSLPADGIGHGLQTPFTDPDDFLTGMLTKDGNRNHSRVDDPDLAALVRKQQLEVDQDKRLQLVWDVVRAADDKMYIVPLHYTKYYNFTQPWVQNYWVADDYDFGSETWAYISLNRS